MPFTSSAVTMPGDVSLSGNRQHLGARPQLALLLAIGDGVQHDQPADEAEFGDVFDAERAHADHAAPGAAFVGIPSQAAVVHHRPLRRVDADVPRAVELRADLPDSAVTSSS